jgi:transcription factor IIIB subunit 2
MQPPAQPVEGKLDTKTWKASMPQEAIDEIESMFLLPQEPAQKEVIFSKINKDYVEAQTQKEKHRNSTAEAAASKDKELEERALGMECYRKRKDRGKDTAETIEEALLQAVANHKISRKINYNAMSAIFEDGNFSTGRASVQDPFETEMEFGEV